MDTMNLARSEVVNLYRWLTGHFTICPTESFEGDLIFKQSTSGTGTKTDVECTCGLHVDITDYTIW